MNKTILTYGLLSGAVGSALMVATVLYSKNSVDLKNGELFGYAGILLSMLFVYFGVRFYRDHKVSDGPLGFGEAFKVAILIAVISSVCYVIVWLIVYETLMPDFMDKYIAHTLAEMKNSGATVEKIAEKTAELEKGKAMYANPLIRAAITFIEPFPIGVFVSLVSSLVLRQKK